MPPLGHEIPRPGNDTWARRGCWWGGTGEAGGPGCGQQMVPPRLPESEPPPPGAPNSTSPLQAALSPSWGLAPGGEREGRNWLSLHLLGASSRCLTMTP